MPYQGKITITMKKTIFSLVLSTTSHFISGQPVITAADVTTPMHGTAYVAQATNFSPGNSGENQIWDFTSLSITQSGQFTINPAEKPLNKEVYQQQCVHNQSPSEEKCVLYKLSKAGYDLVSLSFTDLGDVDYVDPKTILVFPFEYSTAFEDTYCMAGDKKVHHASYVYDAYGTLKLPFGTYTNVIRQKTVNDGKVDFFWYNVKPFYPIMQTSLSDGTIGLIKADIISNSASTN